jgi:hypothetical protein
MKGWLIMNRQLLLHKSSRVLFMRTLFALALVALPIILLSCKPSASPSTFASSLPLPPTQTEVAIRQALAIKATDLVHIDQTETAARSISRTKVFGPTYLPVTPEIVPSVFPPMADWHPTPVGAGFLVELPLPFNKGQYHIFSQWVEDRDGGRQRIFVYTGEIAAADGGDTNQGVVIVQEWQVSIKNNLASTNLAAQTKLLTPLQTGAVKIKDARGERLLLQSINGTTFYFDVPLHQFVPSLTWTPTPGPISPIATPISTP